MYFLKIKIMNKENKDIVVLCPNGIVKFYNSDGTRKTEHSSSFYRTEDIDKLKKDFIVKYS
jgi:hypothetical protein